MARPKQFDPDVALETAMHTFWTHGYAGTTPQRLVDDLGIGRGSLYGTFGSKDELFARALDRYRASASQSVVEALGGHGTGAERLHAALTTVARAIASGPAGCLLTTTAVERSPADDRVAATVTETLEAQRSAFEDVVADGVRDGSLLPHLDPAVTATWLLATTNGLQVLARTGTDADRLVAVLTHAVDTLSTAD